MQGRSESTLPACADEIPSKGLKKHALSFLSNIVIGISSTAPAYSLASALGVIAASAAFATPAVMILAFIPMVFIATACFHLNRADPDCGTTFSWVSKAMGPHLGWLGGWAMIATNILVMPSLAVIAGQYTLRLFGHSAPSPYEIAAVGAGWIAIMTAICYFGIEISARAQQVLLGAELLALLIFSILALASVYGPTSPSHSSKVALGWFSPLAAGDLDKLAEAFLAAVFVYWGWDTGLSVNEETKNSRTAPGYAAVGSTLLLLLIYVLVATAAIAFAGPALLAANRDDIFAPIGESVLGPGLAKLLIVAVLTSAAASTQTTILPAARTALSMAAAGAAPVRLAAIHPRYLSPSRATIIMGLVSLCWYLGLTILSKNVLEDSILALGLCISFYYGLTALACLACYRRQLLLSVKNFVLIGAFPAAGALSMMFLFVKSFFALGASGATSYLNVSTPLLIGTGALFSGALLMAIARRFWPEFFARKPQSLEPDSINPAVSHKPAASDYKEFPAPLAD